ncbi:A/G-specific adenine glycosylase [Brockia lithotrophica]|uniref:Adenine DNA glycosylase n=1 Tax=Brockia lithotrophica TaxID=933949 RepID=A0A660KYJ8_9BACL|nr:A/G-specific adenine glycosylase [Brockia lithotrophica]RKQ85427.1 A/G-specific DNA-adenine glycosylase [Brockia lithotrophica]
MEEAKLPPSDARSVGPDWPKTLLAWYAAHRRPLPWRTPEGAPPSEADVYRTVVSEFLLMRTRVRAAEGYFRRFLERFPGWDELARASEEEVLRLWQGIGFYRRAAYLRGLARAVVERHGGRFPRDPRAWDELPGIGPYLSGLLASKLLGLPEPAVDGNAQRVVARLFAWEGPKDDPGFVRRVREVLRAYIPSESTGTFNEALMELGETVCTPRAPRCLECPLQDVCAARRSGEPARYPRPATPKPRPLEQRDVFFCRTEDGVLLARRDAGLLARLWHFPHFASLSEQVENCCAEFVLVGTVEHAFTHRRWLLRLRVPPVPGACGGAEKVLVRFLVKDGWETRWFPPEELARVPMPRVFRKVEERLAPEWRS